MPKITFIDYEGTERNVDVNVGETIMEAATSNDIPGIDADCGGACACATCHVYIAPDWFAKVGAPQDLEAEMLDVAEEVKENSRLACQLTINDELDGIVVLTPESQF